MTNLTNEFLEFAWHSLTTGQQDAIVVKYYIFENMDKSIKELQKDIRRLDLSQAYYRSNERIRNIKKYEIPLIFKDEKETEQ